MSFMEWEDKFSFGIPEIDTQHKKWLEILNRFYDHLTDESLKANMTEMINEALSYTLFHFHSEEEFMKSMNYPNIAEQRAMHINIANMLSGFKKDVENNKIIVSTIVTKELKKWFNEHILIEDKKYADYFQVVEKRKHVPASGGAD